MSSVSGKSCEFAMLCGSAARSTNTAFSLSCSACFLVVLIVSLLTSTIAQFPVIYLRIAEDRVSIVVGF